MDNARRECTMCNKYVYIEHFYVSSKICICCYNKVIAGRWNNATQRRGI